MAAESFRHSLRLASRGRAGADPLSNPNPTIRLEGIDCLPVTTHFGQLGLPTKCLLRILFKLVTFQDQHIRGSIKVQGRRTEITGRESGR